MTSVYIPSNFYTQWQERITGDLFPLHSMTHRESGGRGAAEGELPWGRAGWDGWKACVWRQGVRGQVEPGLQDGSGLVIASPSSP